MFQIKLGLRWVLDGEVPHNLILIHTHSRRSMMGTSSLACIGFNRVLKTSSLEGDFATM
jgi:hypothetical protein